MTIYFKHNIDIEYLNQTNFDWNRVPNEVKILTQIEWLKYEFFIFILTNIQGTLGSQKIDTYTI